MDTDLRLIDRIRLHLYSMPIVAYVVSLLFVVVPSVALGAIVYSISLGNESALRNVASVVMFGIVAISIVIGRAFHERGQRRKFASPRDRMLFARSIDTAGVPEGGVPPHWTEPLLRIVQQRSLNITTAVICGLALLGCAVPLAMHGGESAITGTAACVALAAFIAATGYVETRRADRVERLLARPVTGRSEA